MGVARGSCKGWALDISWYGQSCLRISGRGELTVVTDPCVPVQRSGRGLKADVVCVSHANGDAAPQHAGPPDGPLLFERPGEYEVGGVFMRGIAMHAQENGATRHNVAWLFHFGALNLLHLGALAHVPEQEQLETLGEVHVLMIPLGAGGLDADAAAGLVALLEPRAILPLHNRPPADAADPLERFLGAMGLSQPQEEEFLRITASNMPEQSRVVLLQPRPLPE